MLLILLSGANLSLGFCRFTAISYRQMGQLPSLYEKGCAYGEPVATKWQGIRTVLKWVLIFALIVIVASILGFSVHAAGAAGVSKLLLLQVLLGVVLVIGMGMLGYRALRM